MVPGADDRKHCQINRKSSVVHCNNPAGADPFSAVIPYHHINKPLTQAVIDGEDPRRQVSGHKRCYNAGCSVSPCRACWANRTLRAYCAVKTSLTSCPIYSRCTISPGRASQTNRSLRANRAISSSRASCPIYSNNTISSGRTCRANWPRRPRLALGAISSVMALPDDRRYLPGDRGHRNRYYPLINDRRYLPCGSGHRDGYFPLIDGRCYLPYGSCYRNRDHPLSYNRRDFAAGDGDVNGNISHGKCLELP